MPTVTIDYTPAYEQGGGIGRYVRDLVNALAAADQKTDYRLFVAGANIANLPAAPGENFVWRATTLTPRWLARLWHRAQIPLPVDVFTGKSDLYHATDFVLPPVSRGTRTLLTVHDLSFVRVPEAASPNLKAYLDKVVPRSVHRADHILADSAATRQDLIDLYGVSPDKITVLLSGVDQRFQPASTIDQQVVRTKYQLADWPYVFSVGTVQPRKNYGRIIEALAQLRSTGSPLHLVVAGGRGWLEDPIYATVQATGMADRVHFIGFADEADLNALYSAAACVAFPSLYEGFGLPVLEAMACGVPVFTSNRSSLPEVAGDVAPMVDPYDTAAIAQAIHNLTEDEPLRQQLIQVGFEHIKAFTWAQSAAQLYEIYNRLLTSDL